MLNISYFHISHTLMTLCSKPCAASVHRRPELSRPAAAFHLICVISDASDKWRKRVCVGIRVKSWNLKTNTLFLDNHPDIQCESKKVAPIKLFAIFSLRLSIYFREILPVCYQFISRHTYQFWSICLNI